MGTLIVNGKETECEVGTLATLLEHLKVNAATVVAEVEGRIVERDKFAVTELADGQKIELIRFVPGG